MFGSRDIVFFFFFSIYASIDIEKTRLGKLQSTKGVGLFGADLICKAAFCVSSYLKLLFIFFVLIARKCGAQPSLPV